MNATTGKSWSEMDLSDFGNSLGRGDTIEAVAEFLCRDVEELHASCGSLDWRRPASINNSLPRPPT